MQQIFNLINEMSPYLLLGFGIAGIMHTFIPGHLYSRYLSKNNVRSVLYAAAIGVPLPLCSCGVLPTAMSLRHEGASKGATTSFLIATPQTGIDSIIATYSLMGFPFAIIRPIAALTTALIGGTLVNLFSSAEPSKTTISEKTSCDISHKQTFKEKIYGALSYGYVEMMQDIGKWLVIGLLIAGLITVVVPNGFFTSMGTHPLLGMLFVLVCAIPMYLCATGSIPIAVALMLKGLTPGAALVLLMAGPAVNVASVMVIRKVLGSRTLWLYLAAIVTGALTFALGIDYLLPRTWFTDHLMAISTPCHTHLPWFNMVCSAILAFLLINAIIRRYFTPHQECLKENFHTENITPYTSEHEPITNQYSIVGMHCNHCRNSVMHTMGNLEGVDKVEVDLTTGTMHITGIASPADVIKAVESLGFGITLQ